MTAGSGLIDEPVYVVGATGRTGQTLIRDLLCEGVAVVAVARDPDKFAGAGLNCPAVVADLTDADGLNRALGAAGTVVSCAHARFVPAILAAAPTTTRFVFLGSTRRFTRWPDEHANGVLAGEDAFLKSGRSGVMLHPTMIYGAMGENNVRRLAALLRKLRVAPLPDRGSSLVQPIHQDDVVKSVEAALRVNWRGPQTVVIAGPAAMTYADFCRAIAKAAGIGPIRVVSVPTGLLMALAPLAKLAPFLPKVGGDELRRLTEDKAFDIDRMRDLLNVEPRDFSIGLAETFA